MEIFEEMESRDKDLKARHPQLLLLSEKNSYGDIVKILRENPALLTESNEEALLLRALCLACVGKASQAKTAVQNSMILKFSRNLGANGVDVFFSRLQGSSSSAQNLFFNDLAATYDHITKRGAVLRQERLDKKEQINRQEAQKKEIYASFLQPDGTLMLPVSETATETDLKQKEWFDNLPEDYKSNPSTDT